LAIGTEVFVAEAASDLEVFLEATDLEELLVLLRGLGEGVEGARVQAGGDEEVACTFRGGVGEDGRFDFEEALFVEEIAGGLGDAMAQLEVLGHFGAAQVQVAVGKAEIFVGDFGVEGKGRDVRLVENGEGAGDDLDFAGGELWVFAAGEALDDAAGDLKDVFSAESVGGFGDLREFLGAKDDLGEAFAVAEVDENHPTVVSARIDPACQGDLLADVFLAQTVTSGGAVHR
jgi:hypothetical protein